MAPSDREPNRDDRRRMDEIRDRQTRSSGDPRLSGQRGGADNPEHVVIDGAAARFFDSFRPPTPEQGPQRPHEEATGENQFRALITDQRALAQAVHEVVSQLRSAADMATRFSTDMNGFAAVLREARTEERDRVFQVLGRIEQHYERQARDQERGDPLRGSSPPAPPSDPIGGQAQPDPLAGRPIPDLNQPLPGGGYAPAANQTPPPPPPQQPPPPSGGSGGGGGGGGTGGGSGGSGGGSGRPPRRPPINPATLMGSHRSAVHRASHGGLRGQILHGVAENLHQQYGLGTQRSDSVVPIMDDRGNLTHFEEHDDAGNVLRTVAPGDPDAGSFARRAVHAYTFSRMAGALATGQGLGGAARTGLGAFGSMAAKAGGVGAAGGGLMGAAAGVAGLATKAIPVIGWAMSAFNAIQGGLRFAQDQRAKNAYYQSIYGGANTSGFGQRFQEEGFVWGQKLTTGLPDEQARALFKGVSSMGFRDQQRGDLTDWGQRNYKNYGMDVNQSMKAIAIAAAGANTSLTDMTRSLDRVTQAAVRTGQNADVLRDKFLDTMGAAVQSGFGVQSASAAATLTEAGPGRSREMANADYSGVLSETNQRVLANRMGVTYGQLVAQNAQGDSTGMFQAQDQMVGQMMQAVVPPETQNLLNSEIAKAGGIEAVQKNPELRRQIGLKLMESGQLDPGIVKAMSSVYGVDLSNVPMENVGEWVVDQQTGGGSLSARAKEEEAKNNQHQLTSNDKVGAVVDVFGGGNRSTFVADNYGTNSFSGAVHNKDADLDAYANRQDKTNASDPAIEAMIQAVGHKSEVGVQVQTKDGPKVVSQADAITYYADQVARGDATLVGGPADISGRKIGELTGVTEKNFQGETTSGSDPNPDAKGVSTDDWLKNHPTATAEGESAQGGKVTIELSDEAKKLFNITTSGNVTNGQVEAGASGAVPPAITGSPPR